jgi:putative FmdB family regulatory protein
MPIYDYQCVECGGRDERVAGLDDATALCVFCGGLMLRVDEDVFAPYFEEVGAGSTRPGRLEAAPTKPGGEHGAEKS